nr:hypothetical protein [Anatilimnocola aggregata]
MSDEKYRDKSPSELLPLFPDNYPHRFCFVVDRRTLQDPEHPVLVVGFSPPIPKGKDLATIMKTPRPAIRDFPPNEIKTYRVIPSELYAIENNLSIGNMDFDEFANAVDMDSVFRGFAE